MLTQIVGSCSSTGDVHVCHLYSCQARGSNSLDRLARGKQSIAVDLKQKDGINVVKRMCCHADVLIEPYRKGEGLHTSPI